MASIVTLLTLSVAAPCLSKQVSQTGQAVPVKQQDKADKKTPDSATPQQPAAPTKVTLEGPITVINQPDPKDEQRDAEQRAKNKFDKWIAIVTMLLVAIATGGAVGAWVASRRSAAADEEQVRLLKEQVADDKADAVEQRRIALEGLAETRKAADAAGRSAVIADQSLKTIQRPFVTMRHWRIAMNGNSLPDGKPTDVVYLITPVLMNSGVTPTRNAKLIVQYTYRRGPGAKLSRGHDFRYTATPKEVVLGPKADLECVTGRIIAADLVEIQKRNAEFYVWGEATYRDDFGDTPVHHLRFCYKIVDIMGDPLNPRTRTNPDGTDVSFAMFMHPEYNDAT